MAQYFIDTCEKLINAMVITGILFAYMETAYPESACGGRTRWIRRISGIVGILSAIVMAVMKNFTNKVNTSLWNLGIFIAVFTLLVIFYVFTLIGRRKPKLGGWTASVALGLTAALLLFYALPDVLAYPYAIYFTNKTVLSTDFLLKTLGVLFGILLCYLAGLGVYQTGKALGNSGSGQTGKALGNSGSGQTGKALGNSGSGKAGKAHGDSSVFAAASIMLLLLEVKLTGLAVSIMISKRYIASNHFLFTYAKNVINYSDLFIYGILLTAAFLAARLLYKSAHVDEPYANQAQHRKIKAKWMRNRRWCTESLISFALIVFTLTGLEVLTTQVIELSPIEDAVVKDGAVYVSFDQVSDGHLHRFGYTTENNVTVRFIVIQKPNSSSYGIGLDACDICGETGYYEKDDQVVCNLCDVVMNINTIGFKGGCNPIIIDYSIQDGYIIVPVDGLLEYENEFK